MRTGDLKRELDVAIRLAGQAGDVIMQYYRTSPPVYRKAGNEPVTAADRAADDLIVQGLRSAFPDDGLLTEESHDDLSRLDKDRVWIVDPLDGTTEFLAETDEFVVQIALTARGLPILGVVYQPVTQQLFYAVQGLGAYQVCGGQTARLHVSPESDLARMRLVASRSHYSPFVKAARRELGISTVERVGSVGLKVSLVAQGVCDLYLATTVAREWDICAPHALLLEADGILTDLCGTVPRYNKPSVLGCRGLVGSNGLTHAQIVERLAPLLER